MFPKYVICNNKKYLSWIRQKPCAVCQRPGPSDAHHAFNAGKKNHGNDALAMPLCREHHTAGAQAYHRLEARRFEEFWNVDLKDELLCLLSEFLNEGK